MQYFQSASVHYWKKVKLHNSTFWNVGEKSGFPFSIWSICKSWAIFWLGWYIFSRGHATLHLAVSVGKLVGWCVHQSIGPSHFWIPSVFCITAPAKPSTGLPCIWPCFVFTAKKEPTFFFQMAHTRGLYNHFFFSYDFLKRFLFFVFCKNAILIYIKSIWTLNCLWW